MLLKCSGISALRSVRTKLFSFSLRKGLFRMCFMFFCFHKNDIFEHLKRRKGKNIHNSTSCAYILLWFLVVEASFNLDCALANTEGLCPSPSFFLFSFPFLSSYIYRLVTGCLTSTLAFLSQMGSHAILRFYFLFLGMVSLAFNPSTGEAKAVGSL